MDKRFNRETLKNIVREIIQEEPELLKSLIDEVLEEKYLKQKVAGKSREERLVNMIGEDFDKYGKVFKDLA